MNRHIYASFRTGLRKLLKSKSSGLFSLKQEAILYIALCEIGINPSKIEINIDHKNGTAEAAGVQLGLVFPKIFFNLAREMHREEKEFDFCFDGYVGVDEGRRTMLEPFAERNSIINFTRTGRELQSKGSFNCDYYELLARSKFALCPHQEDWPYPNSVIWTYRFVEACMAGAVPVVFTKTPLSEEFTAGLTYYHDDIVLQSHPPFTKNILQQNYEVAMSRFTLSNTQTNQLYKALNL